MKIKIAAFNAKKLGITKVRDETVVDFLTKIISRYSVIVIQEVVDKSGKAMEELLRKLNNTGPNRRRPYSMIASSELGRDKYKEKFVCFYREDEATLIDTYQYEDNQAGDEDAFAREPFILRFEIPGTEVEDLVLIPVHTKPKDAKKEVDELHDVVTFISKEWRTKKIMILGDFNAAGRYLSKKTKAGIRICSAQYHWLIGDDVDTTASNNNENTYDRIVVFGKTVLNAIVPDSATTFNFQEEFGLSDDEALSISDHYPVEVELKQITGSTSSRGRAQGRGAQRTTAGSAAKRKSGGTAASSGKRRR